MNPQRIFLAIVLAGLAFAMLAGAVAGWLAQRKCDRLNAEMDEQAKLDRADGRPPNPNRWVVR